MVSPSFSQIPFAFAGHRHLLTTCEFINHAVQNGDARIADISTKETLEMAKRVKDLEGLPRVTQEKVSDFLPKAKADARDLPV